MNDTKQDKEYPYKIGLDGKPFKLIERDGRKVRQYKSGHLADHETGKIIKAPEYTRLTPEKAADLNRIRAEQLQAERQAGIIEAVREDGADIEDIYGADKHLTKVITREVVLSAEAGASARVAGYKAIQDAAGLREDKRSSGAQQGPGAVNNALIGALGVLAGAFRAVLEEKNLKNTGANGVHIIDNKDN